MIDSLAADRALPPVFGPAAYHSGVANPPARRTGSIPSSAPTIFCPHCAEPNPPGFVWCKICKESLTLPPPERAPILTTANLSKFLIAGAVLGGMAIFFLTRGKEPPPAAAAPSTSSVDPDAARNALKRSLEAFNRAASSSAPPPRAPAPSSSNDWLDRAPPADPNQDPFFAPSDGKGSTIRSPFAASSAAGHPGSALPIAPPSVTIRQEGNETVYEMKVRMPDGEHTVRISGQFESTPEGRQFVPSNVDTGGLPIDPEAIKRQLTGVPDP